MAGNNKTTTRILNFLGVILTYILISVCLHFLGVKIHLDFIIRTVIFSIVVFSALMFFDHKRKQ